MTLCIEAAYKGMPDRVKDVIKHKGLCINWIEFILFKFIYDIVDNSKVDRLNLDTLYILLIYSF